ncbi:hypothetical protein E2C01_015493 [Portunus trituberculatus]|uniref:Uncharacterized protein n=1 Tax=Portunus trituberculatus TaxID=210409 RepID=A0A5B7DMX8_PORTR|nr:hypothetical protein [Portunus trituberculatus]
MLTNCCCCCWSSPRKCDQRRTGWTVVPNLSPTLRARYTFLAQSCRCALLQLLSFREHEVFRRAVPGTLRQT